MKLLFNHGHTRTGDANTCVGMSTIGSVRSSSTQYCSAAHTTIKAWLLVVVIGVMGVSHIVCAESSFDPYGTGYKWGGIENGVSYRYSRPPYVYTAQDSNGNTVSYTYNYYYESNGNFKGPWYIGDRFVNGGHIQGWRGPFVAPTSPYSPKGRFICPVTINGAKMVGVYGPAFMGATITELVIQSPMTTLGIGAFSYCTNLLSVSLPQTLTSLHSVQSGMTKGVFENCEKLSWIDLPPSLVEVDSYTFSKCRALKGITIPYRVTNVNASVFSHCSTLKYTAIEAPAITKMDLSAWSNCTNMVAVFCKGDEPFYVTNSNALDTASSAMTFYVPMGKQWTCDVVNSTRRWPKGALGGKRIVFWNTSDIITNANALGISVSSVGTTGKNSVTINTKLSPSVVFYTTNGIAATYGDALYEGTFEIPTGTCVNAIAIGTNGNIAVARTLSELPPGSVSVSGYSGVYDGLGHGISVAAPQKAQVGYSFSEIGPFVEALELTNACTNVRIWCEVSASGYLPQTNSATVSIARKPIYGATVSLGNALAYTGNEQTQRINSVYVDGLPVTYSVVGNTATDRGEHMMTIIGEGNFMGSIEKSYSIQDFAINARQRYPWNGLVDLNFTITGTSGTKYDTSFTAKDMVGNTNIAMRTIRKADGTSAAATEQLLPGTYNWVWDAAADLPKDFKCDRVTVTGTAEEGHGKVQLWAGGPYWATTNIGATKPEEYGDYFWWGDTIGYKRANNKWVASDGSSSDFSFYDKSTCNQYHTTLRNNGWTTSGDVLTPEHDAARVHWGGGWRMPTFKEFKNLIDKCDWTWSTVNGIKGYIVRGRSGYASANIFLPAAGFTYEKNYVGAGANGYYWSSVPNCDGYSTLGYGTSCRLTFSLSSQSYSTSGYTDYNSDNCSQRYYGLSVRPVQNAK